jgi:hypothetical protein
MKSRQSKRGKKVHNVFRNMPLKVKVLKGAGKRFYGNFETVLLPDLLGR